MQMCIKLLVTDVTLAVLFEFTNLPAYDKYLSQILITYLFKTLKKWIIQVCFSE